MGRSRSDQRPGADASVVRKYGINVNRHRIYAFGGSMGGQETLLLVARFQLLPWSNVPALPGREV
jgi:predicted peptidase